MERKLRGERLVIASHNNGKVKEFVDLLAPFGIQVTSAAAESLAEPEETGSSFAENAMIKALAATEGSGLPALSDDSGLVVPALGGQPGIRSARWAGPEGDFDLAMARVERKLAGLDPVAGDRAAYFVCALGLAWPDGRKDLFEGRVDGTLVFPPRGDRGFGYDPIFLPDGHDLTFGEMTPADKHRISHRARAFEGLVAWLR